MPRRASPRFIERQRQGRGATFRSRALKRAIKAAGGVSALARELGITPQSLSEWPEPPLEHVVQIEQLSGVSRFDLRPDLRQLLS